MQSGRNRSGYLAGERRRRSRPWAWALALVLLLASCGADTEGTSDAEPGADGEGTEDGATEVLQTEAQTDAGVETCDATIRMGQSSFSFIYLPLYVAIGSGAFEDVGVEVEFTELGGAATVTQALAAGDLDFSVENAGSIITAANEGVPVRVILTLMDRNGLYVVGKQALFDDAGISRDSSFEEKVEALSGQQIAIASPGGGTDQLARFLLREAGMDPDTDAELIGHEGSAAMVSSFVADRVDAVITSAPSVYTAIDEGDGEYLWNLPRGDLELTNHMLYTGVGTSQDMIDNNPDLVSCVVQAMGSAIDLMRNDPDTAAEAAREFFPDLEDDLYATAFEDHAAAAPEDPVVSQEAFETTVELLNAATDSPMEPSFDEIVHTEIPERTLN